MFSTPPRPTADAIFVRDIGLAQPPRAHPRVAGTRYAGVGVRLVSGVVSAAEVAPPKMTVVS